MDPVPAALVLNVAVDPELPVFHREDGLVAVATKHPKLGEGHHLGVGTLVTEEILQAIQPRGPRGEGIEIVATRHTTHTTHHIKSCKNGVWDYLTT